MSADIKQVSEKNKILQKAADDSSKAMEISSASADIRSKCLIRRAKALEALRQFTLALNDYTQLSKEGSIYYCYHSFTCSSTLSSSLHH